VARLPDFRQLSDNVRSLDRARAEAFLQAHWRLLVFLLVLLLLGGFSPSSGFTKFALLVAVWVTTLRWAQNEDRLEPLGLDLIWGRSFLMWRTDHGKRFIERMAQYGTVWRRFGDVGLVMVYGTMVTMLLLLVWQAFLVSSVPKSAAVSPKLMLGLPGINPVIPLGYGVAALAIAVVVHEFCHGILARVAKVKLKALGLLFFAAPIGAFVEPDEEEMIAMRRIDRMRLYAVGPASNITLAFLFALLFSWGMVAALEPAHDGALTASVMGDYAAGEAGLEPWMLLTSVNGTSIKSAADFGEELNKTWAGQNVTVQALDKGQPRSFDVTLDDKGSYYLQYYPDYYEPWMSGKGFLGVGVTDQAAVTEGLAHPAQDGWSLLRYITLPFLKLQPFPEHFTALFEPSGLPGVLPDGLFWMTANLFYWIFWLNLMVGMTNALPAVPLDGGFIFGDSVAALLDRLKRPVLSAERKEEITDRLVSALAILVVALVVWQLVGPRLIGTDVVFLQARFDSSAEEGWNGDSFEFDASSSVGGFVEWEWDFGDGITASGEQTSHAWDTGKAYYVVLTAKDADGRQSRAYQSIVIDQRSEGDGDVDALDGATETIATNPYIDEVRVEISVTGDNLIFSSSVTVTFSPPEGDVRQQSITVGSGNTQVLDWIAQGKVGDWTVELESEDFEFSYIVAWELDYRLSAE
jgi:membrane-associated protease RseP (regulator of RpoE activity)